MPDIGDARTAYREAVRKAEEAALAGETPQEVNLSVPPETPAGQSGQGDTPVPEVEPIEDTSTEVTPAEPEPEPTAAEKLLAGKYKNVEDLERAYLEAQSAIGRQGAELEEARGLRQEFDNLRDQLSRQPTSYVPITQEMIYNDPAQATLIAFQTGNESVLETAFTAWREEDPFTASQWLTDRRLEAQQRAIDARLAEVGQQVESVAQPQLAAQQEAAQQAAWREAFTSVSEQNPDFDLNDAVRLLEEVGPQFPEIARVIAEGDARAKAQGMALLYAFDRGKTSDPAVVAAAAADASREAATSAAEAVRAAGVVSQDSVGIGASPTELTPEQQEAQAYIDRQRGRVSLKAGWTGRG